MLPLQHRINHSDDFRRVFRRGKKHHSDLGLIVVIPAEGPARLGVVVSKAVGGAVVRNRVKRLVRAAFAQLLPELGPVDVVVKAAASAKEMSFNQVVDVVAAATPQSKDTQ